jgi:carboxyl-terminal processing protease
MDGASRERVRVMLRHAYDNVRKHYYDTKFNGLDWDARFKEFDERVRSAASLNAGMMLVADFLDGLDDSHTFFVPPSRPYDFDYGLQYQAYGNEIRVSQVRPGSDAAAKLKIGEVILAINGVPAYRETATRFAYLLNVLSPQPSLALTVAGVDGVRRDVRITTRTRQGKRFLDLTNFESEDLWRLVRESENQAEETSQQYYELEKVMVWRMPEFGLEDAEVDRIFDVVRKHEALVLDLRGNPGGRVDALLRMVGSVFPSDIQVATRVSRTPQKPMLARSRGDKAFHGEVIVLIDARSASAAELFARVIQLEGRGTVVGDRSSGRVMQSMGYAEAQGMDTMISYYFSVTNADVIMKDGKSLEHTGVIPSEVLLPSSEDLAAGRDPVLARALQMAGLKIDPVRAGQLFPFKWRPF